MTPKILIRHGSIVRSEIDVHDWSESDLTLEELKERHGQFVYSMVATGKTGRIYHDDSNTHFTECKLATILTLTENVGQRIGTKKLEYNN